MSNLYLFPNDNNLWNGRFYDISGNYGQKMLLDSSTNFAFSRNGSTFSTLGSNVIAGSTVNGLNVNGTYLSNAVSALKIPADSSNNRPPGQSGYIRYNTDSNVIEYWNGFSSTWLPISSQPPVVTSISPNYVPEDSSFNYTLTGDNFDTGCIIQFIGNIDNITYSAFGPTNFINKNTLQVQNTLTMSDASNNTGFFVRVISTVSGLSYTTPTAILNFNTGPIWVTTASANLGTGISSVTYTKVNRPFTDLSATDIHVPVTFAYTPSGGPVGASGILLDPSGILYGTSPTLTTSVSSTYSFTAIATDASGSIGPLRSFFFSITLPLASITGGTVGYTDSSGNNFVTSPPYANGYTVYIFTAGSSINFATSAYFPPYVSYLIVGGGGAGGAGDSSGSAGGGGGAGGYLSGYKAISANTSYTISVGAGGTGTSTIGNSGGASSISGTGISLSAAGGGGGANNFVAGAAGGSGGGGGLRQNKSGGAGNTPSTTPAQGNAGGGTLVFDIGAQGRGGGGGGALARGSGGYGNSELNSNFAVGPGGTGGSGITNNIRGTGNTVYAGGGGAGGYDRLVGSGGSGGGGAGSGLGNSSPGFNTIGVAGTANTGGGGGGSSSNTTALVGGAGGSGIVILRHLSNIISSSIPTAFTINGTTYSGTPLSGTYVTAPGYNTGISTSPGTATVTYVDSNGINPRAFGSGPYSGGYTIVTFLTTTPVSPFTVGSPRPVPQQVLYYANTTDFSFNAISQFPAQIEYLIVAGGGTGAKGTGAETYGGGGGAGQVLTGTSSIVPGTTYTIKVASGAVMDPNGASSTPAGGGDTVYYNLTANGANSSAFGLTATGGQGGNGGTNTVTSWNPAGTSGVGGTSGNGFLGGLGPANGANGLNPAGGGGGAADFGRPPSASWVNSGGFGIASAISGTYTGYGGGGSGGGDGLVNGNGGTTPAGVIIGGAGSPGVSLPTPGTPNTGSGGGGMRADDVGAGGGGGTGIIIIKFPSFVC
jgi:hypothetical protein